MEVLAIIPARGGSKGIPRKNLRILAGKPLVAWSIDAAKAAKSVARVVVSTDDEEIAKVSKQHGAEVVTRPVTISGDEASSETALLHVLESLQKVEGYVPEIVVFLQCTSPLTIAEDIDGTVKVLLDQAADSALAATPFHYFLWRCDPDGGAVGINHDKSVRLRRQDRESQYLETGAVYVMKTKGFLQTKHRFFGETAFYVMPAERRLEIDEPVDLQVAEVILQKRERRIIVGALPNPVSAVVFDFDGVFTDNRVIVFQDGSEAVLCDRGDGLGLVALKELGLALLVISSERNPIVKARCEKLGIPHIQGVQNKLEVLTSWLQERCLSLANTVYLGNDVNDVACIRAVGCGAVVRDGHPAVRRVARIILDSEGGKGSIRELCDLIVQQRKDLGL